MTDKERSATVAGVADCGAPVSVKVEKRKYPALVRVTFDAYALGIDHWGEWLSVPAQGAVLLLPTGEWWVAWFRRDGSLRVDIGAEVTAGDVSAIRSFVDLDLDIEREAGEAPRILDEDQFAERCGAYPPSWVAAARRVTREVADRARRRGEPFGSAHLPWMVQAGWGGIRHGEGYSRSTWAASTPKVWSTSSSAGTPLSSSSPSSAS